MLETINKKYHALLSGKRIASLDFGLKRIGFAYCDEFHITVTPYKTLYYDADDFWEVLKSELINRSVAALIVGVPYRLDNKRTEVIVKIEEFICLIKQKIEIEIITYDESYSTIRSTETMVEIGKKKKHRAIKEEKDKLAAAIILRDFLTELDG